MIWVINPGDVWFSCAVESSDISPGYLALVNFVVLRCQQHWMRLHGVQWLACLCFPFVLVIWRRVDYSLQNNEKY